MSELNVLIGKGCKETDKELFFGPAPMLVTSEPRMAFLREDCLKDFVVKSTCYRLRMCSLCSDLFKTEKWNEEYSFDKKRKLYIIRYRRDCDLVSMKCNNIECNNIADCGIYGLRLESGDEFVEYDCDLPFSVLMRDLGIFKSSSQARKNGWNKDIPSGWSDFTVGKKKTRICILKILEK
jgi:hypothetical protein